MGELIELNTLAAKRFRETFESKPSTIAWAPGRINLIGEHTDYNDGLALPSAIDCGVSVALKPRTDRRVAIHSSNFNGSLEFDLSEKPQTTESWTRYAQGAVSVFQETSPLEHGFDALFIGDVPAGAGLSSSAALLVAWMNALRAQFEANFDDWQLVRMAQRVEHEHLGVHCGLLDQIASQFSKANQLMEIDFRDHTLKYAEVNLTDYAWVAVHSGKSRELASSAYDTRVRECKEGLSKLREEHPELNSLRDAKAEYVTGNQSWEKRIRHLVSENQRVRDVQEALMQNNYAGAGRLLTEGHSSLRDDYEVSCPELDTLVKIAQDHAHWAGGRMMGGGFGGCTINLVNRDGVDEFISFITKKYREHFPELSIRCFAFQSVAGARVES